MGLSADDLHTKLLDVTHVPLSELRAMRDFRLLDALRCLVENVPLSDRDEIQEPGQVRDNVIYS